MRLPESQRSNSKRIPSLRIDLEPHLPRRQLPCSRSPWNWNVTMTVYHCVGCSSTGSGRNTLIGSPVRSHKFHFQWRALGETANAGNKSWQYCAMQRLGLVEVEYGLTSHQTHYRSYRGRFLRVRWPNQQCQALKDNSWFGFQVLKCPTGPSFCSKGMTSARLYK